MRPLVTMREALIDTNLLGAALPGESFAMWRMMLVAMMGEPLSANELAAFREVTGRDQAPPSRIEEALLIIGRRGGKDRAMSVLAAYVSALCDHSDLLSPGERGVLMCLGADQRQARVQRDYVEGAFDTSPMLSRMITNRTVDAIELENGVVVEVRAASFRRLRGATAVAVIASETAFWHDTEGGSANADTEILNAVRPTLATTGGPLILITTPYARRGETWGTFRRHYGPDGDPLILVAKAPSRAFNPTLNERTVQRALERDRAAASAEWLAEFRADIEGFVSREAIDACVETGVRERAPVSGISYSAFVDPSGGSADSFTLAVAHRERDRSPILDCIREMRPPFSPEAVVAEFCRLLKSYSVTKVRGDRYAGEWPREQFRKHGVRYEPCAKSKSEIYVDALPLINSGRASLLDHARLLQQLCSLERRTSRAGKDSIDHAPGAHDDVANAACGALVLVGRASNYTEAMMRAMSSDEGRPYALGYLQATGIPLIR